MILGKISMSVIVPDDLLQAAQMTEGKLKLEIAVLLYQQRKISGGKARHFAGLNILEFQKELANRGLHVNYEVEDFHNDLETLLRLGDL